MTTRILLDLTFEGKTPLVAGDKRLTMTNLDRLLRAINHGARYRTASGNPKVKTTPTIVPATATVTIAAPTTGQTVTIAGTAMTAQQSRARSVVDFDTAIAGDTVTVGGVIFTGTAGAVVLGDATWSVDSTDAANAISFSAQLNAYADPAISGQLTSFVTSTSEVTIVALAEGTSGNAITLTSSSNVTVPVTGSGFLAGGAAIANNKFDFGSTDALVAASLARAINASTTANIQKVTAVSDGVSVVTLTAVLGGVGGNAITLTSSDGATLAVTGSGFLTSGSQGATTTYTF